MTTRAKYTKVYVCSADGSVMVAEYKDVPGQHQAKLAKMGGLPCRKEKRAKGIAYPGPWCRRCAWGSVESETDRLLEDEG